MRHGVSRFFGFLMVVAIVLAGGARPAAAIAYGDDVPDGDYPFSVRLTMTGLPDGDGGTRDSSCSGALIAPRWVITAGHCFRDDEGQHVSRTVARSTTAVVGRTDLRKRAGHEIEVIGVRQAGTGDVALAELKTAVTDVWPLRIATGPPVPGERIRLTGYGRTEDTGDDGSVRLQTGLFTVDSIGDSLMEVSGVAPRRDTSACPHDSGGPYFRELADGTPELVALVSTGPQCPHTGADLGARTDGLVTWIAGEMNSDGNAVPPLVPVAVLLAGGVLAVFLLRRARRVAPGRRQ
ncbi:S1 family peptidase [Actinoplanes philippinensis]|uniref:S1 family peptidase n=1 Tax=Actinoplanes philippinensis TaxID=35752 RepID=UPI0033C301BF